MTIYTDLQFQSIHNSRTRDYVSIYYVNPIQYVKDPYVDTDEESRKKGNTRLQDS